MLSFYKTDNLPCFHLHLQLHAKPISLQVLLQYLRGPVLLVLHDADDVGPHETLVEGLEIALQATEHQ